MQKVKRKLILLIFTLFNLFYPIFICANENKLLADLKKKCQFTKSLKANFLQKHYSSITKEEIIERGIFYFSYPNLIRFEYFPPSKNLFIANKENYYFYNGEDNIVYKSDYSSSNRNLTWMMIMSGCEIEKNFLIKGIKEFKGKLILLLDSKTKNDDIFKIKAELNKNNLEIEKIEICDELGDTNTFIFSDIQINISLSEDLFYFRIPKNADIVLLD